MPAAAVLMSRRTECRKCGKPLQTDQNWKPLSCITLLVGPILVVVFRRSVLSAKYMNIMGFLLKMAKERLI
ncbi:Hypothetical predicted protein [Paramuricea clavata]|uniref:Uncharacterized protein n=1 Tax=Paramuricea clavata TaxID=317549 RepID=A0A6S7H1N5_PARCT|nr:Hypothetical predicted protein [Paramuricea clavata]